MALQAAVLALTGEAATSFTLAATTASATKAMPSRIFTITADQPLTVTWAGAGLTPTTPSASVGHFIPANVPETFDGGHFLGGNLLFFNISGSTTANIFITPFSQF